MVLFSVSDRCYEKKATDFSGEKLCFMIKSGLIGCQSELVFSDIVPDERDRIQEIVKFYCDELKVSIVEKTKINRDGDSHSGLGAVILDQQERLK